MKTKEFYTGIGLKKTQKKSYMDGTIVYCYVCKMYVELPHAKHAKAIKLEKGGEMK